MFIAELGIEILIVEVDLMGGENRQAESKRNLSGQCPALLLDDGNYLAEATGSVSIWTSFRVERI